MKIAGKKIEGLNTVRILIGRPDGNIEFIAQGIPSYEEFNKVCPAPNPPKRTYPDGRIEENRADPKFKEAAAEWANRKGHWTILKSLSATKDLVWETVDMENPETWEKYLKELQEAGLSEVEITKVINGIMTANGLNQVMIDEAEKRFLAGRGQEQAEDRSPSIEP